MVVEEKQKYNWETCEFEVQSTKRSPNRLRNNDPNY